MSGCAHCLAPIENTHIRVCIHTHTHSHPKDQKFSLSHSNPKCTRFGLLFYFSMFVTSPFTVTTPASIILNIFADQSSFSCNQSLIPLPAQHDACLPLSDSDTLLQAVSPWLMLPSLLWAPTRCARPLQKVEMPSSLLQGWQLCRMSSFADVLLTPHEL